MRSIAALLVLIIALAPALEALAGDSLHAECGSASPAMQDPDVDMHAAHDAAAHDSAASADFQDPCECGCDCGPGHGCTAASIAAPATSGTILLFAGAVSPQASIQPLPSRIDTPLYRPPITRLAF